MESPSAPKILFQIGETAHRISTIADEWVLQADAERHFHFRTDNHEIDDLIQFLLENSLIFGNS